MKIQHKPTANATTKRTQTQKKGTSFDAMIALQSSGFNDASTAEEKVATPHQISHHEQPLEKVLLELESIILNLEEDSKDHRRAQLAIDSLRDALEEMPQTFPLTEQDREEAKALLVVESKRIDELFKYEGNL